MLRLSSYLILSEPLPGGGHALLNGCTGAIDLISDELAEILREALAENDRHNSYISQDILPEDIVRSFMDRGYLTTVSHKTEREHAAMIARIIHDLERAIPRFVVVPSLDCNYRCVYCFERPFQNQIDTKINKVPGQKKSIVLTTSHVEAIYRSIEKIEFLAMNNSIWEELELAGNIASSFKEKKQYICLYGGEPLNADNKYIIEEIIRRGIERGYRFTATTNGHDLDQFLPFLGENIIEQLQITFDGPQYVHDKKRISKKGDSSFEKIVQNIRTILTKESPPLINIRVHLYPSTIAKFAELLETFEKESWLNNKYVVIYASNIFLKDKEGKVSSNVNYGDMLKHLNNFTVNYKNIFIGGISAHYYNLLLPSLRIGDPNRMRATYCAANSGMYIFSPDGYIYSCWESFGKETSRIGNYLDPKGPVFDKEKIEKWFSRSVDLISECMDCPYCLLCGGGCAQYAEYNTGTLLKPYCDDFYELYPSALAKAADDFLNSINLDKKPGKHNVNTLCN